MIMVAARNPAEATAHDALRIANPLAPKPIFTAADTQRKFEH